LHLPAAVFLLVLTGCAALAPPGADTPGDRAWRTRQEALAGLHRWRALGRVSLQAGEQAFHASVVWDQDGDSYRVRLLGPLGQGAVEIAGREGDVTLRTARGETYRAQDPETLMAQTLGWWVPVRGLRHWLLGRDDPGAPAPQRELDPGGRPLRLAQAGWEVRYLDYAPGEPVALPSRLELDRADLHVRLVVSRWELTPS
jgi:outer membrane lipoprotein LolB